MTIATQDSSIPHKSVGVFISHRGADKDLAERLAKEILNAGYNIWLDEWEIDVGDSIIEKINSGLNIIDYLVLCYSQAGVLSPWMGREWMSTLARQLNSYNVKILPVRLSGGEPPPILADIKYADMVQDWQGGVDQLLQALR